MSSVLVTGQHEQEGSDFYNRFEYQVHWIVCHYYLSQILTLDSSVFISLISTEYQLQFARFHL